MADDADMEQAGFGVRFGWGANDTTLLAARSDVVVIVDVLRFTTAVSVAVERGAVVFPYRWRDASAHAFAASVGATLAESADATGQSLSPVSLRAVAPGERIVLPSPNGSTLTLAAAEQGCAVLAGSLRCAAAVAEQAAAIGGVVSVIAAGERWNDGSLRPCVEDLLGAGAVLSLLPSADLSPEARLAVAAFAAARSDLGHWLRECASGRELRARGYDEDVAMAADLDSAAACPVLRGGAYVAG